MNLWIREAVDNRMARAQESPEQRMQAMLEMLGSEDESKKTQVHLLTFARLLPGTAELAIFGGNVAPGPCLLRLEGF